jgi:hypothetical protein
MRNAFRYKVRHSAAAAAGPACHQDLHNSTSDNPLTDKAIILGKRLYSVCKFKSSQTPPVRSVESNSTLALSDHTVATDISLPPVDLGHSFEVPGVSTASPEASTPIETPVASTHTDITECSVLERDKASVCTAAKPKYGLGKRFKAKCRASSAKTMGVMVAYKWKVLVNIFGDAVDARNTPATIETHEIEDADDEKPNEEPDEEDDEDDEENDEENDKSDDDGQPQALPCTDTTLARTPPEPPHQL